MADDVVRQYEQRIDNGYRALPVVSRPLGEAVYGVLAAFDSHILSEYMVRRQQPDFNLAVGQAQLFKLLGEGFSLALRWLLGDTPSARTVPKADDKLIKHGAELIDYGRRYYHASIFYSGYSQKEYTAECGPQVGRLRFVPRDQEARQKGSWGFADEAAAELEPSVDERRRRQTARERAGKVFVQVPHRLRDGRIEITDFAALLDPRVRDGVRRAGGRPGLLPSEADLVGFNMGEFDRFCHAVQCWSACATDLYMAYAANNMPQHRCLPTQVVPRSDFVRVMTELTGLPAGSVEAVLDRLTADHRTGKLDAYLQPFVCGEGVVAWSVRAVQLSAPQRNLLKLMARTPAHRALAANLIGSREGPLLADMARWLEPKGWVTATTRSLPVAGQGEVDLLGWSWTYPDEVLVVEAKAVLQADEPNEVRSVTRELQHAQGQLSRVVRALQQMDAADRGAMYPDVDWSRVSRWYGVVVTPESEPSFGYDHSTYPAASVATLKRRLTAKQWRSPSRVWQAMMARDWQAEFRAGRVVYESFELAGVTFETPVREY